MTKQIAIREVEVPAPKPPKPAFVNNFVHMGKRAGKNVKQAIEEASTTGA